MEGFLDDEKNYILIQLVLTGISPLAVRKIFDKEFHPVCLKTSLKKEAKKINQLLHRGVLNQTQMNLLYPKSDIGPSSRKFDISLMLCLLRNLTEIDVYDQTPQTNDTSVAADLGRIKYYRNWISHINESKVSSESFILIWTDITQAIKRIGGSDLYTECQTLKQKLANSDERIICEIFNEMQTSRQEIEDVKDEMLRLKDKHYLEIDLFRTEHQDKTVLKRLNMDKYDIKNNYEIKKKWREHFNSSKIILSTAARITFDTIMHNQFVIVSGISGSGKSTVTQNAALRMSASRGYLVVSHMSFRQHFPHGYCERETGLKIIYVMDGFLCERSFSDNYHVGMNTMFTKMKDIAERNLNSRFLMTCKPDAIGVNKIKDVLPSIVECNLHSPELKLSLSERQKMCSLYFPDDTNVCQNDEILLTTDQLPLLCTLYTKYFCTSFHDFVLNPDAIITRKIVEMKESENLSYICLALLLILGGENILVHFNQSFRIEHVYTVVQAVLVESRFRTKSMSRNLILSGFDAMEGIYVKKEEQNVSFIHDKVYEVVVNCIGRNFTNSILQFAKYSFIEHFESRLRQDYFESREHTQSACIVLNQTLNDLFFARLLLEIKQYNQRVFTNMQNKDQCYRTSFIKYLKQHLVDSDLKYLKQPFVLSCKFGYEDFVSFIVGTWKKQLKSLQFDTDKPLFAASSMGHLNIVKILVESSIGIDKSNGPFQVACQKGYTNIVKLFLNHGIYPNIMKCFEFACDNGHAEVLKLLLEKKPKLLLSCYGNIRLQRACTNGFEEIVGILLSRNVLVNNTNTSPITPLYLASMNGYWNIVKMLLNASAKVNERDICIANWNGHEDIAKFLQRHLNFQNCNAINPDYNI